jgi:hypothetical protein
MSNVRPHDLHMIRIVLVIGAVLGSALLMPLASLGVFIGFNGLRKPMSGPEFTGQWALDLTFLVFGLGGVFGFFALLAAELAPRRVQRAGRPVRLAVLVSLAWGSVVALALGILVALANASNTAEPAGSCIAVLALVALALVGLSSWWRTKRGV